MLYDRYEIWRRRRFVPDMITIPWVAVPGLCERAPFALCPITILELVIYSADANS